MRATSELPTTSSGNEDLSVFLERYSATLRSVFRDRADASRMYLTRGLPPSMMREILAHAPLRTFIPSEFGGRGEHIHECLRVVEETGYESLAMALTLGINGALFLQPVSKYGVEEIKAPIFERFMKHQNMGGLMMTEPAFGSDALNIETSYSEVDGGRSYHLQGMKHWGGLTGLADFWLVLARSRTESGQLARDVDFFVCDSHRPEQAIRVEERFESLGLFPIPYGRNRVDLQVPKAHRLVPKSTGLKMLLDMLHRSRLQFPAMGMGYLRRLLDDAVAHARERRVSGKNLYGYDQVQRRIARLQAAVTACNAMCLWTAENAAVSTDLAKQGILANAVKSVVTDLMQEAAQSLLQLVGAKGYRFDHIAGRSVIDSRPFQIFEGSNDILYDQLAQAVLKPLRRGNHASLYAFLREFEHTSRVADRFKNTADFKLAAELPQRRVVDLGWVLGRILTMELVIEMGERGYSQQLVENCLEDFRLEVVSMLGVIRDESEVPVVEHYDHADFWHEFLK